LQLRIPPIVHRPTKHFNDADALVDNRLATHLGDEENRSTGTDENENEQPSECPDRLTHQLSHC
jgi:hypothetical protein